MPRGGQAQEKEIGGKGRCCCSLCFAAVLLQLLLRPLVHSDISEAYFSRISLLYSGVGTGIGISLPCWSNWVPSAAHTCLRFHSDSCRHTRQCLELEKLYQKMKVVWSFKVRPWYLKGLTFKLWPRNGIFSMFQNLDWGRFEPSSTLT